MHEAIDGCGSCHRILEDLVPFAEDKITGDNHASPLIAFCKECEEHLDLFGALLDVADVVQNQDIEFIEFAQSSGQRQVAFRGK